MKGISPMDKNLNTIVGVRAGTDVASNDEDTQLYVDGEKVSLRESLKLRMHSPTGFNWGYGGSGPSQSALGILQTFLRKRLKDCDDIISGFATPMNEVWVKWADCESRVIEFTIQVDYAIPRVQNFPTGLIAADAIACLLYQQFKFDKVAGYPQTSGFTDKLDLWEWIEGSLAVELARAGFDLSIRYRERPEEVHS